MAKPQQVEGIQQVISELRKLNATSKKDIIREKEVTDRAEKLAVTQEVAADTGSNILSNSEDFQRRFMAGQAKTLLEKGRIGQAKDENKPSTRGKQDELRDEVIKLYTHFTEGAADDREDAREKDKEKAEKKGGMFSKIGAGIGAVTKSTKGFFGKLLSGLGGIGGVGTGALLAGVGVLAGGGALFLSELGDLDGKSIRKNVNELMGIEKDHGGTTLSFLGEGLGFAVAMGAIGAGVAAFSVGTGVAAAILKFTADSKWTETLVKNVDTLMGISTGFVENLGFLAASTGFGISMGFIGAGLAAFSLGAVVAAGAGAFGNVVDYFSTTGWSQGIVDNVNILMGMRTGFKENIAFIGESAGFAASMAMIGLGLGAFSLGSAAGIAVNGVDEAIKAFGVKGFAQGIVDNVNILLGMTNTAVFSTANIAGFTAGMLSIGVGLAAFAIGEGASGIATAVTSFSKKGWTEDIKDNVLGLLDMTQDERFTKEKIAGFTLGMAAISLGLTSFNASKILDTFVGLGAGVVNFFTGNDSPIEKIEKIGENADKLELAATALGNIAIAIGKLNALNFSSNKFRFSEFAADLAEGTNGINTALYGGTWDTTLGFWKVGGKIKVDKGLAKMPQLDFQNAGNAILMLQNAIGGMALNTAGSGGTGSTVNNSDNSSTVVINHNPEIVAWPGPRTNGNGGIGLDYNR